MLALSASSPIGRTTENKIAPFSVCCTHQTPLGILNADQSPGDSSLITGTSLACRWSFALRPVDAVVFLRFGPCHTVAPTPFAMVIPRAYSVPCSPYVSVEQMKLNRRQPRSKAFHTSNLTSNSMTSGRQIVFGGLALPFDFMIHSAGIRYTIQPRDSAASYFTQSSRKPAMV